MSTAAPARSVDVVVVTYNPGQTLAQFLAAVARQGEVVASVTVVDNASTDDAAVRQVAEASGARWLAMGRNAGYGSAANAGAALGEAPWVALCNSDIELHDGALAALVVAGEAEARVGAVGPCILEPDGSVYPSARPLPGLALGVGHAVFGHVWPGNPWTARYRVGREAVTGVADVGWLSGACVVVRRAALDQVAGFDERYFMFFEDVDLGRRLAQAGWLRRWVPDAVVTHLGGHTWRANPEPMIRAHHASARRYVAAAYPGWWRAPVRLALNAGLRAREKAVVRGQARTRAD